MCINIHMLIKPCSIELRLSFNFHDRKRIPSDVYFRHPLFGLQSTTERTPARIAHRRTSPPRTIATEGNPNVQRKSIWRVGGESAIPVICDTRSRTEWKLDAVTWIWRHADVPVISSDSLWFPYEHISILFFSPSVPPHLPRRIKISNSVCIALY